MLSTKSSNTNGDDGDSATAPLQPPPARSLWSIVATVVRTAFVFAPVEQDAVEVVEDVTSVTLDEDEVMSDAVDDVQSDTVGSDTALSDTMLGDGEADAVLRNAVDDNVSSAVDDNEVMSNALKEEQSGAAVSDVVVDEVALGGAALDDGVADEGADRALSDVVLSDVDLIDVGGDYGDDAHIDNANEHEHGTAAFEATGGDYDEEEERTTGFDVANDCESDNAAAVRATIGHTDEHGHAEADAIDLMDGDSEEDEELDESEEEGDDDNDEDYEEEDEDEEDDGDAASVMLIGSGEDDTVGERKLFKCEARPKAGAEMRRKRARNSSYQEFPCDVVTCGASFTKKENLLRHIAGFHEAKPGREYKCDPCGLQFRTRHEKELHSREVNHQRFPCTFPACGKSYSKREHLNRHVLSAHRKSESQAKPFRCELCDIGFAYAHGLVRHKNRSHVNQNKPYECAQCLLAFKKKSDLQAHSYVHTGVLPFECEDCSARFAKRFQLVRHERSHAGKKKPQAQVFFCEEDGCKEMLLSAEEKRKHDNEVHHKEYTSTNDEPAEGEIKQEEKLKQEQPSGSTKKSKKRKRRSDSVVDAKAADPEPEDNRRQLLVCQVCEHTFQRKQYLRAHLRTHFEELDERTMHVCPMAGCDNAYTRKSNLMAHYNAVHDAVRSQRFTCPFEGCEGKFGYKKVLTTHIDSVHVNPTPAKKRRSAKSTSVRTRALGMDENSGEMMVVVDG